MTSILGISAYYHDSAAALIVDGEIVAAAQEERFTRKKHDERFPKLAIEFCLSKAGLTPSQLDFVTFYEKPILKFERLLETYLAFAPRGYRSFLKALPSWLHEKLQIPREIRKGLQGQYRKRILFPEHHESHAASAFFPSPFENAAILTLDGVGEWTTTSVGVGRGNKLELLREIRFPHSLGLLYSAFTYYCGFQINSGEYKLMGLAPFGEPTYADQILKHLIDLREDGSFHLDLSYFNYCTGLTMTSPKFHALFGGPPRKPESELTQREMDLAASIQRVTEEVMLRCARFAQRETGLKHLCLAGGVALNCVGNGKILREKIFDDVWIQPAAGDAGGALGSALFVWHQLLNKPRNCNGSDFQKGSRLGPGFEKQEIESFLEEVGAVSRSFSNDQEFADEIARLISRGQVIGWFDGRMEFGPRALGGRSILGDARNREMQSTMNLKIKFRESFRPFAPIVLDDQVGEYFEMKPNQESPYMLLVAPVHCNQRLEVANDHSRGLEKLKQIRSSIPAVTHVDNSARVQTVDPIRNPRLHRVMKSFQKLTGCGVMINTSFNVRSEPIVCTPRDAFRCFMATNMDALVLGDFLLLKEEQPNSQRHAIDEYLAQFDLD